uniref:Uncharacterized protein n=1 Tax=Trichogramma kaykai TaxID=54128 RepID=A0ABD2WIH9_9HYME
MQFCTFITMNNKCTRPGTDKVFTASANISREECLHAAAATTAAMAAMEKPNTLAYTYNVVVAAPHVGAARDVFIRVIVWDRRGLRVVRCWQYKKKHRRRAHTYACYIRCAVVGSSGTVVATDRRHRRPRRHE